MIDKEEKTVLHLKCRGKISDLDDKYMSFFAEPFARWPDQIRSLGLSTTVLNSLSVVIALRSECFHLLLHLSHDIYRLK